MCFALEEATDLTYDRLHTEEYIYIYIYIKSTNTALEFNNRQ